LRQQFVERIRLKHGARKQVRADFRAFFEDADIELRGLLFCTNGTGEACRAGADHDHVVFHHVAFGFSHFYNPD